MPHGSNRIFTDSFPNVTNSGDERFIGEISDGTIIGYKYFEFEQLSRITLNVRGSGGSFAVSTSVGGEPLCTIEVPQTEKWTTVSTDVSLGNGVYPLYLTYSGSGTAELIEISFE
jgi:hypothetical protein